MRTWSRGSSRHRDKSSPRYRGWPPTRLGWNCPPRSRPPDRCGGARVRENSRGSSWPAAPQQVAREHDGHRPRERARVAIAARDRGDIAGLVDDLIGHVDGVEHRAKIKAVRGVVLVMIADAAAQG